MAEVAFVKITGKKQGVMTAIAGKRDSVGNQYTKDHEEESRVIEVNHKIMAPKDPNTGQISGAPVHEPVILTKILDSASPQLATALVTQEDLDEVVITFMRTNGSKLEAYANWVLGEGKIVAIESKLPDALDPDKNQYGQLEEVHITYGDISWNHVAAGTSGAWSFGDEAFAGKTS